MALIRPRYGSRMIKHSSEKKLATYPEFPRLQIRERLGSGRLPGAGLMAMRALIACLLVGHSATAQEPRDLADEYRRPPAEWPAFIVDPGVQAKDIGPLQPLPPIAWHTPGSEALGKLLFFDPRLSGSGQLACVSCHDPQLGWGDGRRVSAGHGRRAGRRNAMTLLNAAYFERLFWDGRAEGLLDLALQPIRSPDEMNANIADIVARLESVGGYPEAFEAAFGSPDVSGQRIAQAIASFARSLVSSPSRFDRFARGEYARLSEKEIEGLHLFRTRAGCMNCHSGPRFSDGGFHHTGLSYYGRRFEDLGRFEITGNPEDRGRFRTPSLRNIRHTGPWMHNGLFTDFKGILRMYNQGIAFAARPRPGAPGLSPLIRPLGLHRGELEALEAFLGALGRKPPFMEPPALPGMAEAANSAKAAPSAAAQAATARTQGNTP